MNTKRTLFIALISFLTILACAIPGQQQAASLPAPTVDSAKLETMVADTVSIAQTQTQQAMPVMPLSTSTPEPTNTPTESASDIGSTLETSEGGTHFVDTRAGYSISIPAGWLAVRPSQQEYYDAWSLAETSDPRIQKSLLSVQNLDPNQYRLFALDTLDGQLVNDVVANILFFWDENTAISFDTDEALQKFADDLPNNNPGLEVTSVSLVIITNGTTLGVIESNTKTKTTTGQDVTLYQKQVLFPTAKGTQLIALTADSTMKDITLAAFDAALETITVQK